MKSIFKLKLFYIAIILAGSLPVNSEPDRTNVTNATEFVASSGRLPTNAERARQLGINPPATEAGSISPQSQQRAVIGELARQIKAQAAPLDEILESVKYTPLNQFSEQVSARAKLETAMARAEHGEKGKGEAKRLLQYVRDQLGKKSAASAIDPRLQELGAFTEGTFHFAERIDVNPTQEMRKLGLDKAVDALAKYQPPYFELKNIAFNCCIQKATLADIERAALVSKNHNELIGRILTIEPPPPTEKEKLLKLVQKYQSESAARTIDPSLANISKSLSNSLPKNYQIIEASTANVPTFQQQKAALRDWAKSPSASSLSEAQLSTYRNLHAANSADDAAQIALQSFDVVANSYAGGPASKTVPGGNDAAFKRFMGNTFNGASGIPRSFSVASRSIRGPGGISLGARILNAPQLRVKSAVWVPTDHHPQFGRYAITLDGDGIVVSSILYSESAAAAWIALFNPTAEYARFQEGEIFPLVTIDRFYREGELNRHQKPVAINPALTGYGLGWSVARVDFWFSVGKAARKDIVALHCNGQEKNCDALADEPSVDWDLLDQLATWQFHDKEHKIQFFEPAPGENYRTVRVCNLTDGCSSATTPDPHMTISPFARKDVFKGEILRNISYRSGTECEDNSTHRAEFFQCLRESTTKFLSNYVASENEEGDADEIPSELLREIEALPAGYPYGAWLEAQLEPDTPPSSSLQKSLQPLIDWLLRHHPDFIKLNDFAEAFTLLRWIHSASTDKVRIYGPTAEQAPALYPPPNIVELSEQGLKAKIR